MPGEVWQLLAVTLGIIRVVVQGFATASLVGLLGLLGTAFILVVVDCWAVYKTVTLLQHRRYRTNR